jgi:uncharacterized membrane protein YdbT with pleckstrin-like domain
MISYSYLKFKSTKYSIYDDFVKYEYNYILRSFVYLVPLDRITNHEINKNIIFYSLFKVGKVNLFTGGSNDPSFDSLEEFIKFNNYLDNQLQTVRGNYNVTRNVNEVGNSYNNSNKITNNYNNHNKHVENKKEVLFETKPGIAFIFNLQHLIFLIIIIVITILYKQIIFIYSLYIIYIVYLIYKILLWNNTKYKFYEDRVIDITGVININQKEIYFKNIKHIKLERKFLFERIFNQGTIHIYTPGSSILDSKISSINEYSTVYKEFKEVIL